MKIKNKFFNSPANSKDKFLMFETSKSTFLAKKFIPFKFLISFFEETFICNNFSFNKSSTCFFNFKFSFFNSDKETTGFLLLLRSSFI